MEMTLDTTPIANLELLLKRALIDPNQTFSEPPICLQKVEDDGLSTLSTLGNISLVIGKAKSGKTFWMSAVMAAVVKNNEEVSYLKASLPPGKEVCLYFDTEQSTYHSHKTTRRVLRMAGVEDSPNFLAYGLRSHTAQQRLELIEYAINTTDNLGFVVIDGIRDLISSTNDEKESVLLSGSLLKWSQEKNIHIMCVLHRNKTDENARGHVGTEMLNKAEIVISVHKQLKKLSLFKVDTEMSRDEGFKPFTFAIDDQGLIQIDNAPMELNEASKVVFNPNSMDAEEHRELLRSIFCTRDKLRYSELTQELSKAFLKREITLTQTKTRELHTFYFSNGFTQQHGKPKSPSCYYTLPNVVG